jgi:hypothetical protein
MTNAFKATLSRSEAAGPSLILFDKVRKSIRKTDGLISRMRAVDRRRLWRKIANFWREITRRAASLASNACAPKHDASWTYWLCSQSRRSWRLNGYLGFARTLVYSIGTDALRMRTSPAARIARAECDTKFPKGIVATAVPRVQCLNDAMAIMRPTSRNPDLLDSFMASRLAVAERIQKGQITMAQGGEEIANKWSQVVAEDQRRTLANRSVRAQETAAENIGGPTSCTRIGNTVNCY